MSIVWQNLLNCPRSLKETAYKTLIWLTLEYGSAAWDSYYEKDIAKKSRTHSCQFCGLGLSHGLVLHLGLTSLHLFPLDKIVQEKLLTQKL